MKQFCSFRYHANPLIPPPTVGPHRRPPPGAPQAGQAVPDFPAGIAPRGLGAVPRRPACGQLRPALRHRQAGPR